VENEACVGIDFGGVIIPAAITDVSHRDMFLDGNLDDAIKTAPLAGCMEGLRALVSLFLGNVWIISKASRQTEEKTWAWIKHHRLAEITGIDLTRVRFCRERSVKADICREIGVSHYIDDQLRVLELLRDCVRYRLWFTSGPSETPLPGLVTVQDWPHAVREISRTLEQPDLGTPS
jgi:hypothetical protein